MDEDVEECKKRWWFMSYHGVPDGGPPLPCLPAAPGAVPDRARYAYFKEHGRDGYHEPVRAMAPYALVLHMMIEDLGSSDLRSSRVSFGDALERACEKLSIDHVALPKDIQGVLLRSAFTMITSGGIPGAPEAG